MRKGSNFDDTETALGQLAASGQSINRFAFVLLMLVRSIIGPLVLLIIALVFSTYAASFGYANVMFSGKLMSASTTLGLPLDNASVIGLAWSDSWIEGWALMIVCSSCIILFGLLPTKGTKFSGVSVMAVCFEAVLGVAGYVLDSYRQMGFTDMFMMEVVVQSMFRAFAPVLAHYIVSWIRSEFGDMIDEAYGKFMDRLKQDFELI